MEQLEHLNALCISMDWGFTNRDGAGSPTFQPGDETQRYVEFSNFSCECQVSCIMILP
ncbi:MAG: hypothetical protein RID53_31590 [Coleofasciculus sp. B1-GNL1-01]